MSTFFGLKVGVTPSKLLHLGVLLGCTWVLGSVVDSILGLGTVISFGAACMVVTSVNKHVVV